jgi:hypothetical protein
MIETTSSIIRRISAFCDGGRGELETLKKFRKNRMVASANLMGSIVKVYRNESKQSMKPKPMIFSIARGILRKLLTLSHFNSWCE